jgi:hypothetical protein
VGVFVYLCFAYMLIYIVTYMLTIYKTLI